MTTSNSDSAEGGMSIEEHVARAIFEAALYNYSWNMLIAASKDQYLAQARAAIAALVPTVASALAPPDDDVTPEKIAQLRAEATPILAGRGWTPTSA